MTTDERITNLEKQVRLLQDSITQMQRNNQPLVQKTDDNANKINAITPYTVTRIGYYGETEKTLYNVPDGNVTVFGLKEYTMDRVANNITLTFDALEKETNITVSIL